MMKSGAHREVLKLHKPLLVEIELDLSYTDHHELYEADCMLSGKCSTEDGSQQNKSDRASHTQVGCVTQMFVIAGRANTL